jgi:hypothetical protein
MKRRIEVSYLSPFALSTAPTALGESDWALSHPERAYLKLMGAILVETGIGIGEARHRERLGR